jgi:hypothetical protein
MAEKDILSIFMIVLQIKSRSIYNEYTEMFANNFELV